MDCMMWAHLPKALCDAFGMRVGGFEKKGVEQQNDWYETALTVVNRQTDAD
jgi:hypothetical protein